jgi:tetratricopeptide (TPR) repeat protein/tRNA A-37 threonylcarbamoyl transferase component Bud32
MGAVFAARDLAFEREVAVKVLHDRFGPGTAAARRFHDEARITGQLQHPAIPPVHDVGTLPDGRPFLAMKLIRGRTLEELLKARTTPPADRGSLIAVFEQVCQAVGYAHDHRVIHRDLKPANVMVGNYGEVQVMDWGLAKVLPPPGQAVTDTEYLDDPLETLGTEIRSMRDESELTQAGALLGTPAFMPPEQAIGAIDQIEQRSDVFGLGAILCQILTGKPPFVGESSETTRQLAAMGDLDEAFARLDGSGAEPELVALCKRCLSRVKSERPADAVEVATAVAALRSAADERARHAEAERSRAEGQAAEQRKRRKVQAALGMSFTALVVLGGAFAWWRDHVLSEQRRVEAERSGERAAVEARARQAVESAIATSASLREDFRFADARAVLDQAGRLIPGQGLDDLRQQLASAQDDLALVEDLDRIRLSRIQRDIRKATGELPQAYRNAFTPRFGDPSAADFHGLDRIAASPVKQHIIVALDDWALWDDSPGVRPRLLAITRQLDPGEWSERLRNPAIRFDEPALSKLSVHPDIDRIPNHLLIVLFQMLHKPVVGTERALVTAATRHRDDFWLQLEAGYYFIHKTPNPTLAAGYFRAALALRPDRGYPMSLLAWASNNLGDSATAVALAEELIRLEPDSPDVHAGLAFALLKQGDANGALKSFRKALQLDPKNHLNRTQYVEILKATRRTDELHDYFREAAGQLPDDARYQTELGTWLLGHGQTDLAIECYRRAVKADPRYKLGHFDLGLALMAKRDPDAAIESFRKALEIDPWYSNARHALATAYLSKGDRHAALTSYLRLLAFEPQSERALGGMVEALRLCGDWEGAAEYAGALVHHHPQRATSHFKLGQVLGHQGDIAGAIASYCEAVRLNPKYALALNNLAWLLATHPDELFRNGAEAVELASRAVQLSPATWGWHDTLAAASAEVGDFEKAVATQRKVVEGVKTAPKPDPATVAAVEARLRLYEAWKPYREPQPTPAAPMPRAAGSR